MRGVVPNHLANEFDYLDSLQVSAPPQPWKLTSRRAVGGLTEVGFADSSDLLLIASHSGRGLVDCSQGILVARDDDNGFQFDLGNLLVEGIGSLKGKLIRMAGLSGGGLATGTTDGWGLERHPLSFPEDEVFLSPPGQTMLWARPGAERSLTKFADFVTELRAFGFSPTGRHFVFATSSDLNIYSR